MRTALTIAGAGVLANDSDVEGSALSAVLVSGPGNGTLTLNADGSFTYTPNANYNGADSFTYKANDGVADSATVTVSLTVTAVNDAPVAVADSYTTSEDTALVFSSGNSNQISITDIDSGGSNIQVTLTATNGTITLAATVGLSFSVGDGTADTTMTFTGTRATINARLNGMSFTPTQNYNGGAASVQIQTSDQGNTGIGGALSDNDTISITVNAINDAPVSIR